MYQKKNNQDTHKFIIGLSNLVCLNRRLPPPQLPPTTLRCRTSSTRTPARFPVAKYDSSEMSSATKFFNGTNFVRGTRHLKCDMDATPNAVSPLSCTNEIRLYRSFQENGNQQLNYVQSTVGAVCVCGDVKREYGRLTETFTLVNLGGFSRPAFY